MRSIFTDLFIDCLIPTGQVIPAPPDIGRHQAQAAQQRRVVQGGNVTSVTTASMRGCTLADCVFGGLAEHQKFGR